VEFASPSEPNRVSAARAPVSRRRLAPSPRAVPSSGFASRGVLAPASTFYVGCPVSAHPGLATGAGKVEVARPPPVPSSGFLPLSTVLAALAARTNPLRSPPFAVAPRRFAALFHAARAPGVALQSFPFSRSRTRSRGPCASLWVRVRPPNGAARPEVFAAPFADRADLSPQLARGPTGLKKPGRRFPGVARASHVSRCRGRLRRLVSERPGSPDSAARTLTSELYSPRESVRGF
jgi:hypothetical protein